MSQTTPAKVLKRRGGGRRKRRRRRGGCNRPILAFLTLPSAKCRKVSLCKKQSYCRFVFLTAQVGGRVWTMNL